jgi:tetratricopeptide (TPR) repeat protein
MIDKIVDYPTENRYQLRRLIQSIEASYGALNLLICICDNPYYRDEIIHDYEAELSAKGVNCDRVQIDRDRPSLKQSLLDRQPNSNPQQSEIVTLMGIDGLLNVSREQDLASAMTVNRSAQEQFFFSTQWTREALREFRFPVILWMTESIAGELSRQAPDFWSWRGGVFEFVRPMVVVIDRGLDCEHLTIEPDDFEVSKSSANPEAIQAQINKILETDPDSPLLRSLYLSLGIAYQERSSKNIQTKNADLEQAISTFHRVLKLTSREDFPEDWATTQHKLGTAYTDRISGERAANLEAAIHCYYLALEVRTREAFPADWAKTQNNLGIAYLKRISGERAANLEAAIRCYHLALEVFTREAFPYYWARTQNNLGTAYSDRISSERAANLEAAIRCYHLALEVSTLEAFPEDWAMTQNNLANAYLKRIRGEKVANLEEAIDCYHLALEVYTREAFPEYWAIIQNDLIQAQTDLLQEQRQSPSKILAD